MAKKRKKIVVAGDMVWETIYTPPMAADPDHVRAAKRRESSEALKKMNAKNACKKLEMMLAANFRKRDLVVHLTYAEEFLPGNRAECEKRLKKFRADLNALRKKKGTPNLVMFWNYEHEHGDKRWHHHCVLNSTGDDIADILACWPWGSNVEIKPLRVDKEKNYATIARYMCKERPDRVGKRQWSSTHNTVKPEVETFWVEADDQVRTPKGALVFERVSDHNSYGSYQFVKYLTSGGGKRLIRAKRKRKPLRS